MSDTPPVIHTHIECDRRKLWHAVIEIRERGRVMFAVTAVKGSYRSMQASVDAIKEAERLGKAIGV